MTMDMKISSDPTTASDETARIIRLSLYAIAALLAILVLMGTVIRISGAVIAQGDVAVESRIKQVTHPTGGVISDIRVRDGQRVKAGDLLMRLDTSVSDISSSAAGDSLQSMLARKARLEAERDGAAGYKVPEALKTGDRSGMGEKEQMLFDLRRRSQAESHAQMRERMRQSEQEAINIEAQIKSVDRQRVLVEPERVGIKSLYDKGLVTINRYNETERTAVDLEAQADGLRAKLAQARAQLAETRQRDAQIDKDTRTEAGNELASLNAQLGDIQGKAASTADQHRRSEIRAPYAGVVDKLAFATVGGFLPAGQVVLEIVPDTDRSIIEVKIAPQDIDQVRVGQKATLHFSAFSQQTTPTVPGKLEWVSAERATDQATGASYYRAHVGVTEADFKRLDGLDVKVGMPAEAYVETGSRTILSYLFKPLIDQIGRAFRD